MALTPVDRDLLHRCLNKQPGSWNDFVDRFLSLIYHVIHYTASTPTANTVVFESKDAPGYRLTYALDGKKLNGKFDVGGKTYLTWTAVKK